MDLKTEVVVFNDKQQKLDEKIDRWISTSKKFVPNKRGTPYGDYSVIKSDIKQWLDAHRKYIDLEILQNILIKVFENSLKDNVRDGFWPAFKNNFSLYEEDYYKIRLSKSAKFHLFTIELISDRIEGSDGAREGNRGLILESIVRFGKSMNTRILYDPERKILYTSAKPFFNPFTNILSEKIKETFVNFDLDQIYKEYFEKQKIDFPPVDDVIAQNIKVMKSHFPRIIKSINPKIEESFKRYPTEFEYKITPITECNFEDLMDNVKDRFIFRNGYFMTPFNYLQYEVIN